MILMDTCAILWDALGDSQLTAKASQAIQEADDRNALIISDISIWEIAMLVKKGRVELQTTAADFVNLFLQSRNVSVVQITPDVADLSVNFGPEISGDPADRIIAATSIIHNARLVTADKNLIGSGLLETLW